MECGHRFSCKAGGLFWFEVTTHFVLFGFTLLLGFLYGLDVSSDGSIVVGCSKTDVVAHNTSTLATLWRILLPGYAWVLRIHGGVVIVPVDNSNTVVFDVTTGSCLYSLPSAGSDVRGICIFDGLSNELNCCFSLTSLFLAPLLKLALKGDAYPTTSGLSVFISLYVCVSV
jgi:hypothetical protein